MKDKPILIDVCEWYYKGCIIQKQDHQELMRYLIFQDDAYHLTVGMSHTFSEAKKIAELNEVPKELQKYGIDSFL